MSKHIIYIVYGQTGRYEDFREWSVRAFKTEAAASYFCARCNQPLLASEGWSRREKEDFIHPLDPECTIDSDSGTKYIYGPIYYEDV